jgi:hypothetical protein
MADPAISLITLLAFTIVVGYAGALIFKKKSRISWCF